MEAEDGKEEGAQELRAKAEAKVGLCPVCKGKHKYQRRLPWGTLLWPSDRLQECKCGQQHHKMLHGSRSAHKSANAVAGLPRGQGGSKKEWFSGKPTGNLLTEGTAEAIFEILEAPVAQQEEKRSQALCL